ncbi:LysR family transcriptional regulator [Mangrovicoccus algicola]|uniref:LysR family transcriptional regulator n=1 Tax=Mangrovicoccus algicola TaxID=2771008 RepID=A0A8J6YWL7_9RHOB|nr:LysR family transcriptional regulator [Mangrovicoccus algicola]MBE3639235.1 LysR family transcriptional regulator [Mangrovicoccus algicola]
MKKEDLADLAVFLAVAEERNFTRAAARLGLSQSAVSHTMRRLEASIGVKLLNRSSRHVSTTEPGEKLLAKLRPGLDQIAAQIEELRVQGNTPSGLLRITASKAAIRHILWPVVTGLVRDYPGIRVELSSEGRLTDLAEDRFDCGIRLEEFLAPDVIAVPVGPPARMAAVAAPDYLAHRGIPRHPADLADHACMGTRFDPHGTVYAWEFEKDGEEIIRRVDGPFIVNDSDLAIAAAREGHGIAFVTEAEVAADLAAGRLHRVLEDWCPPFGGMHLYYPGRRQVSSALRLLIDRLRWRG